MSLETTILDRILPSACDVEHLKTCAQEVVEEIKDDNLVKEYNAEIMLVGSVAKGTFLSNPDIDIFILFPTSTDRSHLQKIGLEIGKKHLPTYEERYAEHPYTHGTRGGYEMDIVPCYKLESTENIKCAVDRTPFHTKYIKTNMDSEMKDQVRLLKQFAKGIGVYGAESKTEGISGYLTELLIIRYGNFNKVIEAASRWNLGQVVFPNNEKKFKGDPLIVHDPVDSNRNVASAVSIQSFSKFIYAAKEYLKNPSERFFFPNVRTTYSLDGIQHYISKRNTEVIIIELDKPNLIDDNLYPQIRKTLEGVITTLQKENISAIDSDYEVKETSVKFAIEIETIELPSIKQHYGPPVWSENAPSFINKWKSNTFEPYVENGLWKVIIRRDDTNVVSYLNKNLKSSALGKDFRELKGMKITSGKDAICEDNAVILSKMIDKRMSWEVV
ncbi:CCA tRNA nucleotidyltransferase [Candidatus Methanomassiliicoccus intestinalis]|uniref:CCA tRNA nucleotidyltransferase n=1 Tax=Candidatus Methanomassiliicoccus intestinalis TaxID=1406512 RepID=UPI0037DD6D42